MVLGYLLVSWALFAASAEPVGRRLVVDREPIRHLLLRMPDLSGDPLGALRDALTAPFLNIDSDQLLYVTVLMLLFGVRFELAHGSGATAAVFFGSTWAAVLGGGLLLHVFYPDVWAGTFWETGWERSWSGGSAGAYGLIGAAAATGRRPWLVLGLVVGWEAGLYWWYLGNFTPILHLLAVAVGFAGMRWLGGRRRSAGASGGDR